MTRPRVLVKLGGSILTNKSAVGAPRFLAARARRLCEALVGAHATTDLALVLGAGSWGHPQALRHRVGQRVLRGAARDRVGREISSSVARLRERFCRVALDAGLPVVSLASPTIFSGRTPALQPVRWMLDGGLVPVTGGDVVADRRLGLRILSGDEIANRLVPALDPHRVVFASDVEGVRVDGGVVGRLDRRRLRRLLPSIARGIDATGGMRSKLAEALEILDQGVEVRIVDGRDAGALVAAVRGRAAGTLLVP